jgi:hypothetical protein
MWASGHNIQQHLFTCCSRFSCLFPEMFWLCTDRRCKHSRRRCRFRASCCDNVFHCRHNKSSTVSPLLISSICHQLVLFFSVFYHLTRDAALVLPPASFPGPGPVRRAAGHSMERCSSYTTYGNNGWGASRPGKGRWPWALL